MAAPKTEKIDYNGYPTTIEKVGKVWRAQVNELTICSCPTKQATKLNAEYILNGPLARAITTRQQ